MRAALENWVSRTTFIIISVAAILGNGMVLGCYYRRRKRSTLTPFDICVISLASSDVLAGVFLIFSRLVYLPSMPNSFPQAYIFCTILWGGYILFALCYVSVYTCLALTVERWLAVFKPHVYRRMKSKQVLCSLIFVWLWTFFINSTVFINVEEDFVKRKCKWGAPSFGKTIFSVLDLSFSCIVPFSMIIFLYSRIVWKIRRMETHFLAHSKHNYKKRVTIVGLAASTALVIGWTPVKVSFMLSYTAYGGKHLQGPIHLVLTMLALSNIFVNPILYGIYSSKFRKDCKEMIVGFLCQGVTQNSKRGRGDASTTKKPGRSSIIENRV